MNKPALRLLGATFALAAAVTPNASRASDGAPDCTLTASALSAEPPARLLDCVRRAVVAAKPPASDVALDRLDELEGEVVGRSLTAPDAALIEAMRLLIGAQAQDRPLSPEQRRDLMWALLLNDRFDEAAALAPTAGLSAADPFPRRAQTARRLEGESVSWRWNLERNELQARTTDLRHGVHVVVLSSPGCHFCADLASAIATNAGLARAFASSIWIQRPEASLARTDAARWERSHPGLPIDVVFDVSGWPMPKDGYTTPEIFFVRDGAVLRRFKGWQPERLGELKDDFRAAGIDVDGGAR